ncbi:MAG: IcmT/TraK family protein [Deltaproteobacteria bacterium]|jgi:intracellular multiplication protein IcmT|nr:IcmT/TraK family protein [Deltaproteobacteria bacterium]
MTPPWAWTALKPRFFILDARVVFPLGLWLLRWAWLTLFLALFSVTLLAILERRGLTLAAAWPLLKVKLTGPEREVGERRRFRERIRF